MLTFWFKKCLNPIKFTMKYKFFWKVILGYLYGREYMLAIWTKVFRVFVWGFPIDLSP